nr:relaxase/mobilization nuclease domain-containing protein [Bosea sp. UNC402CLCol]
MRRARQIAWWTEQVAAARDGIAQAREERRRPGAMWLEEDLRRSRGLSTRPCAMPHAHQLIRGETITGGHDAERERELPPGPKGRGHGPGGRSRTGPPAAIAGGLSGRGNAVGRARLLAAGYQPAVIKVVSYASGAARATATGQYVLREDVPLETHDGRILADRAAVADEIKAWSAGFSKRAESQDVGTVRLALHDVADSPEGRAAYDKAIAAAFEGHRHAYRLDAASDGTLEARVVVAMAGAARERFRSRMAEGGAPARELRQFDRASEATIKDRIAVATGVAADRIGIVLKATGHGRDGVAYQLDRLVAKGAAVDDRGKTLANVADVRTAAREWGPSLRSQSTRDTLHLILSAKAGADVEALRRAAHAFLHDRFADHKFMFGVHTDKQAEGHIHVHAVITVKSESGQKLHPGRDTFREWRQAYAEHAQAEGLKIVATGARERASSQSYGPKDKAIVHVADRPRPGRAARDRAYASDPANRAMIDKARQRIAVARANPIRMAMSEADRRVLNDSIEGWRVVLRDQPGSTLAKDMLERLALARLVGGILGTIAQRVELLTKEGSDMAVTAEQMARDLRLMNEAVSRTRDLLDGATKQQFHEASARYLETLANRLDLQRLAERGVERMTRAEVEGIIGVNADRLIERANNVRAKEEGEAQRAARQADRAVEVERGDQARAGIDPASQRDLAANRQIVTGAERSAAQEAREARAATEAARMLARHPGDRLSPGLVKTDALAQLRAEQERVIREIEASDRLEAQKGQRMGPGRG